MNDKFTAPNFLKLPARATRALVAALLPLLACAGCNFTNFQPPTETSTSAFDMAGSVLPQVNPGEYATPAKATTGPYRITAGDVLSVLVTPREGGEAFTTVHSDVTQVGIPTRVDADGTIRLPFATESVKVGGMLMPEAEQAITNLYFPKYLKQPPLVYSQIREYRTYPVMISGAVTKPGRYEERSDRMTLLSLLSDSGGLAAAGTPVIRIHRQDEDAKKEKLILLTSSHGTGLSEDVQLAAGDTVEVDSIPSSSFTVIGLVNTPGRFDYVQGGQVSLIQALAYAGGINWIADPKFARIYRRDAAGNLVTADFRISDGKTPMGAATVILKPGDVVAVEETARTASMLFLAKTIQATLNIDGGVVYTVGKDARFSGNAN